MIENILMQKKEMQSISFLNKQIEKTTYNFSLIRAARPVSPRR